MLVHKRINRVVDHIRNHLHETLSLEQLAQVAGLSPFHFHRMFKGQVGETLNAFVVRQRLERTIKLLQADFALCLTDAASQSGFQSLSDFSRNFKAQYNLAPSRWDRKTPLQISKIRQTEFGLPLYAESELGNMHWMVEQQTIPAHTLAYSRVSKPYEGQNLMNGLQTFEAALQHDQLVVMGPLLGISLDDPEVTPLEQCFYDWAIPVQNPVRRKGTLNLITQPAYRAASIAVQGDMAKVDQAWQYLYRYWLPRSPYLPAHQPALEVYRQSPNQIGWDTWNLECWLPITEEAYEPGNIFDQSGREGHQGFQGVL
jgi:AraC-like DNA-binding protein/DNA gyrase inhibitor GyrI